MTRIFHWFFMWQMGPLAGFDIRLVFTLPPRDSTLQYKRCVHFWNNYPCITFLTKPKILFNYANFLILLTMHMQKMLFFRGELRIFAVPCTPRAWWFFLWKYCFLCALWMARWGFLDKSVFWVFEFLKDQLKFYLYNENYNYWFNIMSLNIDKSPYYLERKNVFKRFFQSMNALQFS